MDAQTALNMLLDLAEEADIAVRRVPGAAGEGDHPGGALVRLKGREILFLDPAAPLTDQAEAVAAALRGREIVEDRYLPPELRRLIDGEV